MIMPELIYLYDLAPVIPSPTAGDLSHSKMTGECFPVIDPGGLVIGRASRTYCHSGQKPLHPVVHLHIIDRYSRIYLQKRSMKKDIQPGKWDTAVGGHVSYGESIQEALFRESFEELGFTDFNPVHIETYQFESEIEKEMVNVFAAVGSYELRPDMDEVDEGRWWDIADIDDGLGKGIFTPNFESEYKMIRSDLLALL